GPRWLVGPGEFHHQVLAAPTDPGLPTTLAGRARSVPINPHPAANESQTPGTARFPVTWIKYVLMAGVNPPKIAVAKLYASENPTVRTSTGMIPVRKPIIAPL